MSNTGAPEAARIGALQALAALSDAHGRSLASSAMESVALAVKFTARCVPACPLDAHLVVCGCIPNAVQHCSLSCKAFTACDRLALEPV